MENIKYIVFLLWLIILIYDLKKMIIPDKFLILSFFLLLIYKNGEILSSIKGMCFFSFPLFLILLIELHINKELIGLGDIKLMLLIGFFFGEKDYIFIHNYYLFSYFLATLYILILRKKLKEYIPFAPMLIISAIFFIIYILILQVFYEKRIFFNRGNIVNVFNFLFFNTFEFFNNKISKYK